MDHSPIPAPSRTTRAARAAAWVAVGAVGASLLTGIAVAADRPASAAGSSVASAAAGVESGPRDLMRRAGRVLHGEFVVADREGATRTMLVQSGEVTAVDGATLTVKSKDGWTATWTTTDETRVREGRAKAAVSDISVGDRVRATGDRVAEKKGAAKIVLIGAGPEAAPAS
jgi:hypothetical protein